MTPEVSGFANTLIALTVPSPNLVAAVVISPANLPDVPAPKTPSIPLRTVLVSVPWIGLVTLPIVLLIILSAPTPFRAPAVNMVIPALLMMSSAERPLTIPAATDPSPALSAVAPTAARVPVAPRPPIIAAPKPCIPGIAIRTIGTAMSTRKLPTSNLFLTLSTLSYPALLYVPLLAGSSIWMFQAAFLPSEVEM